MRKLILLFCLLSFASITKISSTIKPKKEIALEMKLWDLRR